MFSATSVDWEYRVDLRDQSVLRMREPKYCFSNCGADVLSMFFDGKFGLRHECFRG